MTEDDIIENSICRYCDSLFKDENGNFLCGQRSHIVYGIEGLQITDKLDEHCSFFSKAKKPLKINSITMFKKLKRLEKEEKEKTTRYTSLLIDEEKKMIAEQVYDKNESRFCVWENGRVYYPDSIYSNGLTYYPLTGEEIEKGAIQLPSKILEYGDDDKLDKEIKEFIQTWLDVPDEVLQFAVWNIKRSWVYERFHTLNYLRALGDTGQGKSRFLDTLGYLHYKPINTSGATTSAPVFRSIEKWKGTLVMDEADFQKSDETQDIIKIINQGYERGRFVMRCDKENNDKINFFDPYCPKILATRRSFYDKAMESRCITHVMTGTVSKKIPRNLNKSFFEKALEMRNKLLMWRFDNYFKIDPSDHLDIDMGYLEPRVEQIVSSFINLFKNDQKQLEEFKVFIKKYQENLIDERQNSFEGQIIGAIHSLLQKGITHISAQDIIEEGHITDRRNILLKPRGLTSTLKSLGFGKSVLRKVEGETKRSIPLDATHLINLFKRYGNGSNEITEVTVNTVLTYKNNNKEIVHLDQEKKNGGESPLYRYLRNSVTTVTDHPITDSELVGLDPDVPQETKVAQVESQVEQEIHLNCSICGSHTSHFWADNGKPVCRDCYKAKNAQRGY